MMMIVLHSKGPVITIFTLLVAGAVSLLASEYGSPEQMLYPAFALLGFSAMGPHVLIGLAARELVPPSQSSTAGGLVTMVSRAGGVCAAAPLAKYQKVNGWDGKSSHSHIYQHYPHTHYQCVCVRVLSRTLMGCTVFAQMRTWTETGGTPLRTCPA